jgi:hypothetical protein
MGQGGNPGRALVVDPQALFGLVADRPVALGHELGLLLGGSRAALRSGIPSFETWSAVPPSRNETF